MAVCARSSADQSSGLLIRRSEVRILPGALPRQGLCAHGNVQVAGSVDALLQTRQCSDVFAELRDVRVDRRTVGRTVAASMLGVEKEWRDQPVGELPRILATATSA